ncbi:MAG: TatD family hydrolase [Candidatus Sericytochromatia bacterium]
MQLIDIGINLMNSRYHKDRDDVIKRAKESGVFKMIITGTTIFNSKSAIVRAKKHPKSIFSTVGIHPHNARDCNESIINEMKSLSKNSEVVAVGECGLDFDRDFSPRDIQEKWFEEQIKISCELNLPLFLHEREAYKRFIHIMSKYENKIKESVIHCFTGTEYELKAYLEMGFYIGITGAICDERRNHLKQLVKMIPLDKLMIETDAPFLLPRDLKDKPVDKRNEPCYLPHILNTIANIIHEEPENLANITTKNAEKFFRL